ncbi:MAG: Aspartyl/Asparaginyl beta-hydroxylase [Bacteroidetes bacterium]|nr:Aspartyl/Asparaginyl beta-hydroxylase [Bacteroidota bacterium]
MNDSFPLPIEIDAQKLAADLTTCLEAQWKEHFNTRDYSGSWTAIALRSQSGNAQDIYANNSELPFVNTPLLEECNYFKFILDQIHCEKETVRLLRLQPGSVIKEHRDQGLGYRFGEFRLHIPIITDAAVEFIVGGKNIPMKKGECWYADFDLPHSVKNDSERERIHLVIDGKRNEWTDEWFRSAGYDFAEEKEQLQPKYTEEMINNMIEGLEKINTETSRNMIAELLERKKKIAERKTVEQVVDPSKRPVPSKVFMDKSGLRFRWTYTGTKRFTEPFFSDTLAVCKGLPENRQRVETPVEELFRHAEAIDAIEPSAFIFHVSRCGSTLLSQMLSESERCIVLSEVPLLDDLLRLDLSYPGMFDEKLTDRLFKAAVRLYARRSEKRETHLFIKCDSWHTLFYGRIRRCFPAVPVILLYRSAMEVARSQDKMRGMHAVPGVLPASIFRLEEKDLPEMSQELYFAKVLESYFSAYEMILEKDRRAFPLSYHEGAEAMLQVIMKHTGFVPDEKEMAAIRERTRYHSKDRSAVFEERQEEKPVPEYMRKACEAFQRMEHQRTLK